MKRSLACLTTGAMLAGALTAAVAPAAQASPWDSVVDLTGTITISEAIDGDDGQYSMHSRASMQLALDGPMRWVSTGMSSELSSASARVAAINYAMTETSPGDDIICTTHTAFAGWTNPNPTIDVSFSGTQNRLTGNTPAFLRILSGTENSLVSISKGGNCGGFPDDIDLIDKHDQFRPYDTGIFSHGIIGNTTSDDLISPQWITFKKAGSRWVSQGTIVRSKPGYAVTISWNLASKVPSGQCVVPKTKKVKNKTVKQAKKIVKKAGFKPGKTLRSNQGGRKIKHGRVFGLQAKMFGTEAPCGSKVHMYVRK